MCLDDASKKDLLSSAGTGKTRQELFMSSCRHHPLVQAGQDQHCGESNTGQCHFSRLLSKTNSSWKHESFQLWSRLLVVLRLHDIINDCLGEEKSASQTVELQRHGRGQGKARGNTSLILRIAYQYYLESDKLLGIAAL